MRCIAIFVILCCSVSNAQVFHDKATVEINGDAEVKSGPDRVSIQVWRRDAQRSLETATSGTDAAVNKMIAAFRALGWTNRTYQRTSSASEIAYARPGKVDHD